MVNEPVFELNNVEVRQYGPSKFNPNDSFLVRLTAEQADKLETDGFNVNRSKSPSNPFLPDDFFRVQGNIGAQLLRSKRLDIVIYGVKWGYKGSTGMSARLKSATPTKQKE